MLNYSIHLKSPDPCNLYVNGNFVGFLDNVETFSVDLKVYSSYLIVTKEPLSSDQKLLLPYTVKLNFLNHKVLAESTYTTVVPFLNHEYDVILQQCDQKHHKPVEKVYDETFEQTNFVVANDGTSYLNVYQNGNLKFSTTMPEIHSVICEKINNHFVLKGATNDGKFHLLVLNETTLQPVVNTQCDQVEQTPNSIKYLVKMHDIAKHAMVFELSFLENLEQNQYAVYLNENAQTTTNAKLIPFAFLEAVKLKNYTLAKQYLTPKLAESASDEHLNQYFLNLKHIYYNAYHTNPYSVNYTVECDELKSITFTLENNKIADFEEVEF